jgi:hypothetical protein
MMPNNRPTPATDAGLTPLLFCNETTVAADAKAQEIAARAARSGFSGIAASRTRLRAARPV